MGEEVNDIHEPKYKGCYAIQVLHASTDGRFEGLVIDPSFEKRFVLEKEVRVKKGESIASFTGANSAIGSLFLRTKARKEMDWLLNGISSFVRVLVR